MVADIDVIHAVRDQEIQEAIRQLYRVFAPYPYRRAMEDDPVAGRFPRLDRVPLISMTWDDFGEYPIKAIATWGNVDDFRHFLPRWLELCNAPILLGQRLVFSKLAYARWRTWPAQQQHAIRVFTLALWRRKILVAEHGLRDDADCLLQTLCDAYDNPRTFLDEWDAAMDDVATAEAATVNLARFVETNEHSLRKNGRLEWLSGKNDQITEQVLRWIASAETAQRLERAFFAYRESANAALLSNAHQCCIHLATRST